MYSIIPGGIEMTIMDSMIRVSFPDYWDAAEEVSASVKLAIHRTPPVILNMMNLA